MLGTQIRGIRHLYKLACNAPNGLTIFNIVSLSRVDEFIVFPHQKENMVVLVSKNGRFGSNCNVNIPEDVKETHRDIFKRVFNNYCNAMQMASLNPNQGFGKYTLGTITVALPNTFDSDYEAFMKNNNKILASTFSKYINSSTPEAKMLFMICEGNANFFAWAAKMVRRQGVSIYAIKHFMDFNDEYSQLIKNISKGNFIALNNCTEINHALTEIFNLRAQATAKQTLNWFNTLQKKLLRDKLDDNKTVHILNNFSRLSKTKRINFIRKVSTIEDVDEIIRMMSFLCTNTHFDWNKESFMNFLSNVESLNYEIALERDNVVVLRVHDYETIKRLGKTTNWCISKNKQYWDQYINRKRGHNEIAFDFDAMLSNSLKKKSQESTHEKEEDSYDARFSKLFEESNKKMAACSTTPMQFMVFDFNQPEDSVHSIIGFTATPSDGVTHAHDFVNNNMMGNGIHPMEAGGGGAMRYTITRWITADEVNNDNEESTLIHGFLENHKINVGELCKYTYPCCDWNKEAVKKHIEYYCNPEDYYTLFEDDTKLIIRSYTDNMAALIPNIQGYFNSGNGLDDDGGRSYNTLQFKGSIWHLDFAKQPNDINKILYWRIYEDVNKHIEKPSNGFTESCTYTFNEFKYLDNMLEYYGLPFDSIKRPDTIDYRLHNLCKHIEYAKIFDLIENIKDEDIKVLSNGTQHAMEQFIMNELFANNLKFWSRFAETKSRFTAFLSKETIVNICRRMFYRILDFCSNDSAYKNDLYNECKTVDDFIAFNNNCKDEWNKFIKTPNLNHSSKSRQANKLLHTTDITGNCFVLNLFITKAQNDGFDKIYNSIIPQMVELLYDRGFYFDEQNKFKSGETVARVFVKDNINEWTNITYNDVLTIIKMTNLTGYSTFAIAKMGNILKNNLRPSQVSRIITDIDRFAVKGNNKKYHQLLKMVCDAAKEQHAISEATANNIISSRTH